MLTNGPQVVLGPVFPGGGLIDPLETQKLKLNNIHEEPSGCCYLVPLFAHDGGQSRPLSCSPRLTRFLVMLHSAQEGTFIDPRDDWLKH